MNKLSILFLFFFPIFFQTNQGIEWTTPVEHDFGDLVQGDPAEHFFKFKNTSGDTILIDNVRATCGCTTPDWTWDPIAPDSTSHIRVVYDARKKGYFKKKIKVFFSHQRKATVLKITGYVETIDD